MPLLRRGFAVKALLLVCLSVFPKSRLFVLIFLKVYFMHIGTVKWFNTTKGYGFIVPDDKGADVFVHISAVEASGLKKLNERDKVSYDITNERGKTAACNIKLV